MDDKAQRDKISSWSARMVDVLVEDYSGGDGANSTGKRQRKTTGQDCIQNGSTSTDGKIVRQQRYLKSVGMQMVLQNLHNNPQDGYNLLRIVGSGVSL